MHKKKIRCSLKKKKKKKARLQACFLRSKRLKFPLVTVHRDRTCFENIFFERSKYVALNKNLGISPPDYWNSSLFQGKIRTPMKIWNLAIDLVVR